MKTNIIGQIDLYVSFYSFKQTAVKFWQEKIWTVVNELFNISHYFSINFLEFRNNVFKIPKARYSSS